MAPPKKQKPNPRKGKETWPEKLFGIPLSGRDSNSPRNSEKLNIDRFEWEGEETISEADTDNLFLFINSIYDNISELDVVLCRAHKAEGYIYLDFYSSDEDLLFSESVEHDNLGRLGSLRTGQAEPMDDEKDKDAENPLRPRWAEEARPKKQVKLRLKPSMISQVDAASKSSGKNRNDWIEEAIQKALDAGKPKPK